MRGHSEKLRMYNLSCYELNTAVKIRYYVIMKWRVTVNLWCTVILKDTESILMLDHVSQD